MDCASQLRENENKTTRADLLLFDRAVTMARHVVWRQERRAPLDRPEHSTIEAETAFDGRGLLAVSCDVTLRNR
jgi:hypothetical protein